MDKLIEVELFLAIAEDWNAAIVLSDSKNSTQTIQDFNEVRRMINLGVNDIVYKDDLSQELYICTENRQFVLEML